MTIAFKRFVPYTRAELGKGIKNKPLNGMWKLVKFKQTKDGEDTFDVILQHKGTKLKTVEFELLNDEEEKNDLGYILAMFKRRDIIRHVYGKHTDNAFEALLQSLRDARFVIDLYGLKTKKEPYTYVTEKFGPGFIKKRYK
jgi:hypothetical protein